MHAGMTKPQATLLAVATFVFGFGVCVAVFAALDVKAIFLVGPGILVAGSAFAAYKSALDDGPRSPDA
jgi:hypothetical protein